MFPQLQLLPGAISEILAASAETKTLTLGDRYGLLAAVTNEQLDEEERRAVDRLLRAYQRGRIHLAA
ncbi:hypothetical protein K4A83_22390 [Spirulina subsalsa FACHB-351]|uniref:Uncharacterized protein n=1 Tax=Spirulina subsalsa FACHB-351 TaxID=234711 RepID=A0ABT3LDB8_9CYAN|nr:hypothetical protein [Spirulina subsalsa]MCW6038980.1 hypothetical protein [Spirulina subsalsa FACHB-351]